MKIKDNSNNTCSVLFCHNIAIIGEYVKKINNNCGNHYRIFVSYDIVLRTARKTLQTM